jgi:sugar-phosphatase
LEATSRVFATVECEAVLFGCRTIRPELAAEIPFMLALPGANHVLESLPEDRWALLSHTPRPELVAHLASIDLPAPTNVLTVVPAVDDHDRFDPEHYLAATATFEVDPTVSLAFEDTPTGVAAAKQAGLQVIGVAASVDARALDEADLVVPSLLSVRVLGAHPFIVLEVDAIPDLGSGEGRRR